MIRTMTIVRILAVLAVLLSAFSLHCAAAPFVVRLGTERIVLDAPPGFSDSGELASPRLQELAESLTSASNRILLFALTDADLRKFMVGDQIDARRYMTVVTPKTMERERVSQKAFSEFVTDSLRTLGKPAPSTDYLKFLDEQPSGRVSLIEELRKEANVVTILQGVRLTQPTQKFLGFNIGGDKPAQYAFSTTSLVFIRGKALELSVHMGYDGPADIEWLKALTERWIGDLMRLNK
jgi:hypothetical protein